MMKLNQASNLNMGKVMYSIFIKIILELLFCTAIIMTILGTASPGTRSGTVTAYIAFFLAFFVLFMFQFGFMEMLRRLIRQEFVTLGFLFYGFKKPRLAFSSATVFATISTIALFIINEILAILLRDRFPILMEFVMAKETPTKLIQEHKDEILVAASAYLGISSFFLIFILFLMLPFVFTFMIRAEFPQKNIFKSMFMSARLMFRKGNFFKFIALLTRAAIKSVFFAIIAFFMGLLPFVGNSSVLGLLLNFAFLVNMYTALIRIYLAIPVMYVGVMDEWNEDKRQEELKPVLLPAPDGEN